MHARHTINNGHIDDDHSDSDCGLSLRQTPPVDADARLDAGEHAPADLWHALATTDGFRATLADAVRDVLAGVPYYARERSLLDAGVSAGDGGYARLVAGFVRPSDSDAFDLASDVTGSFGSGEVTSIGRLSFDDLADGPVALLDASDVTPTVAVRIGEEFRQRRRAHRERICWLLATLGQVCSVTVVATGYTARWLAHEHREELPRSFSEQCSARRDSGSPVADTVEEARQRFDADGRAVRILRDLSAEPGETLAYHELQAAHGDVSTARVSQLVGTLAEYELVEKYGPRTEQYVDLLPAGRRLLETIDEEIGRQRRFDDLFSETGQDSYSDVLSRPHTKGSPDGPSNEPPGESAATPYRTRYLSRANHAAAAGTATNGAIVAAETPLPDETDPENRHTRYVSYDDGRDEVVVAVWATTPIQYAVSVAVGLASPRLFDKALPVERLEEIDDPPAILRDGRCIGGLSSEAVEDGEILRDTLVEWGEELADMTRELRQGEHEDRARFCGEILRSAHGLAGTIVHLLDVVGADVVRELRVPSLSDDDLATLAKAVSVATAIQSKYGAFTAYRQLFERRESKRRSAFSVDVDATDPVGEYIGSLVIRGPRARRFGQHVEGRLSSPAPLHEDAPEFSVRIPVTTVGRDGYTDVANRALSAKNLRATPAAVTMLQALTGDPWAVTESIRWLGEEEHTRRIRLDEVRVSLSALVESDGPGRILPDAPPSVSKAVGTLLRTAEPLSQSELADAASVSTRSLRRHLDALVALDLVRETERGYRLALPFQDGERGEHIVPDAVGDDLAARQDLVFDVAVALVDDPSRFGDVEDPVGAAFMEFPPDFTVLKAHLPGLTPWVRVAKVLCNDPDPPATAVSFGPTVAQTPLAGGGDAVTSVTATEN